MLQKLKNTGIRIIMVTLLLFVLGVALWYIIGESVLSLQDILFWVGAAPIAFFSIGMFGTFSGRGDPEYQLSKTVLKLSPNKRSEQDNKDQSEQTSFGLVGFVAGLLIWLISYFL